MTKLLEKAFDEARKLPPDEQEALAAIILEEIADEARWARNFSERRAILQNIIADADAEIDRGETRPLEFPPDK
jgi:hypothetical protein